VKGKFVVGLAFGAVVGGVVALSYSTEGRAKLRELGRHVARVEGVGPLIEQARLIGDRALAAVRARVELAREEARSTRESTRQELWSRFEIARREGHLPPAGPI
jgi:hypothetical protein